MYTPDPLSGFHSYADADVDPCSFLALEAIGEDSDAVASKRRDELPIKRIVCCGNGRIEFRRTAELGDGR